MSDSLRPHGVQRARLPCPSLSLTQSLFKLMPLESVMPSNHLILCCPLFLLPSIFPIIGVFSCELALCIRWPRYWSFSIRPFNEYWGLLSLRIDWFHLLEVQRLSRVFSSTIVGKHNSSAPSLLYGPTLTSLHDHWENHSFDHMHLCQQSDISAF